MTMTIDQARAHFGLASSVSEAVVRAAAEADGITIATAATTQADAGDAGDDSSNPVGTARALIEELRAMRADLRASGTDPDGETVGAGASARLAELEARVDQALASIPAETSVRGEQREDRNATVRTRYDSMGYERSDYEFAMMMFEGSHRTDQPTRARPPEDFVRAWRHHVFESGGEIPQIVDSEGRALREIDPSGDRMRAMDTAESGFGNELIGVEYAEQLWEGARSRDGLVQSIPSIPMMHPTVNVPVDGALPEMLFVGESTGASATAYTTSKTASNRRQLSAKKFTIQQIWSGELDEDSIIQFAPFLRRQLNASAELHLGSAFYNGDTTNAATGNINSDDADPADTKHYLAFDGIRHYWLVDATGQGKDSAGALDPRELWRARGKLNGTDDDVDAAVGNINWGTRAEDLLVVADWDTFIELHDLPEVKTVDAYGAQATVVTGELARVNGVPIIAPGYASKTEADGKASGTETNNVRGALTVLAPRGFLWGRRREVRLHFDRVQRTDQYLFELYTRVGFNRWGGNVAAGIYNIDLT